MAGSSVILPRQLARELLQATGGKLRIVDPGREGEARDWPIPGKIYFSGRSSSWRAAPSADQGEREPRRNADSCEHLPPDIVLQGHTEAGNDSARSLR